MLLVLALLLLQIVSWAESGETLLDRPDAAKP
jgi:hypothetical protein